MKKMYKSDMAKKKKMYRAGMANKSYAKGGYVSCGANYFVKGCTDGYT